MAESARTQEWIRWNDIYRNAENNRDWGTLIQACNRMMALDPSMSYLNSRAFGYFCLGREEDAFADIRREAQKEGEDENHCIATLLYGKRAALVKTLKKGDTITVTGETANGWTPVEHDGAKGYVSGQYIK